ncbi:flagellar basal body-associated FliL family protein [Limoniibacter endophyticus]|uniref:Flagellar protein FliL n=1 Tax=Limoniibacter endophyticus TaxID=1565040 RepID=A0A8J3DPR5_9HYPH|nr:flagellar basal body-associated FliL family protein [Limoniibacter endophyticus]GHC64544.1 flagellar basal body-associated protein FliL [Limoniibacter endophyticus]
MPAADNVEAPKKSAPSIIMQLAALTAATAIAVGVGFLSGNYLGRNAVSPPENAIGGENTQAAVSPVLTSVVTPLEAIITNLSDPTNVLIRLELSLISPQTISVETASTAHQDLLAFVRTLKLHQISGASGFQHMRSELRERVRIRSNGAINDVLIRVFILE